MSTHNTTSNSTVDYQAIQKIHQSVVESTQSLVPSMFMVDVKSVSINHEVVEQKQLDDLLHQAVQTHGGFNGWCLYREVYWQSDKLDAVANITALGALDLLEAEWCSGQISYQVKHLGGTRYLLNTISTADNEASNDAFCQMLTLAGRFEQDYEDTPQPVEYCLWWKYDKDGLLTPLAQQFIGFK